MKKLCISKGLFLRRGWVLYCKWQGCDNAALLPAGNGRGMSLWDPFSPSRWASQWGASCTNILKQKKRQNAALTEAVREVFSTCICYRFVSILMH